MNCNEARDRILSGRLDEQVAAHLRECEPCATLAADEARLARALSKSAGSPPTDAPDDFAALLSKVEDEDSTLRGRLRALPTHLRSGVGLSTAVVVAVLFLLFSRRADWNVYPMLRMGMISLAFFGALVVGVGMSFPRLYRPERPLAFRLFVLAFMLFVAFLPAMLPIPYASAIEASAFWPSVGACIGLGTAAAIPALVTLRLLQRDDLNVWSTIFLATTGGISAHLALQMHCPIVDRAHVGLAHAGLALLFAAVAGLVVSLAARGLGRRRGESAGV